MQPLLSFFSLFSGLCLAGAVMLFHEWARTLPNRVPRPPAVLSALADPVPTERWRIDGARLVGAWRLSGSDPRIAGVSGLAMDGDQLVALTDSGAVLRFSPPQRGAQALTMGIRDLPAGPGSPLRKSRRDSEALTRADGGWFVSFESRDSIWRFDDDFTAGAEVADLRGQGFAANVGIEALAMAPAGLVGFSEGDNSRLSIDPTTGKVRRSAVVGVEGAISDAVQLADGRLLLLARRFGAGGFHAAIYDYDGKARLLARLTLGPLDNPEAIAAAPLPAGGTRLWIMTDNDSRPWHRTLLMALDLP